MGCDWCVSCGTHSDLQLARCLCDGPDSLLRLRAIATFEFRQAAGSTVRLRLISNLAFRTGVFPGPVHIRQSDIVVVALSSAFGPTVETNSGQFNEVPPALCADFAACVLGDEQVVAVPPPTPGRWVDVDYDPFANEEDAK